jgi:hypothetical protein
VVDIGFHYSAPSDNDPPTVEAGEESLILLSSQAQLTGAISDDGKPLGGTLTATWSKASGPGTVTFGNAAVTNTTATFSSSGIYSLELQGNDSALTSADYVSITVNGPPTVNAGADQTNIVLTEFTLTGTVSDDSLPYSQTNYAWTKLSGPGLALFTSATNLVTQVQLTEPGMYLLRLSSSDGHGTASDTVNVRVNAASTNLPPIVDAGPDQYVALTNRAELVGSATDDGLVFGLSLTSIWSKVSGPGNASFVNSTSLITEVSVDSAGVYTFRLIVGDFELFGTNDVVVSIYPENQPPEAFAGVDQTIVSGPVTLFGRFHDDGLPSSTNTTVLWEVTNKPEGAVVVLDTATNAAVTATFSVAGAYTLRFTANDSEFFTSDDVLISVTGNQAPLVNAGADILLDLFVPAGGRTNSVVETPTLTEGWHTDVGRISGIPSYASFTIVDSLAWNDPYLYIGGLFMDAGGYSHFARWDGCSFSTLYDTNAGYVHGSQGGGWHVRALDVRGDEAFFGGYLNNIDNSLHVDFGLRWSGTNWEKWGFVESSAAHSARVILATSNLVYFGGNFRFQPGPPGETVDTGVPLSFNLAEWDGTNWNALGEGVRSIGTYTNIDKTFDNNYSYVDALLSENGNLIVGGKFTMDTPSGVATNLAKWNGSEWSSMGFTRLPIPPSTRLFGT